MELISKLKGLLGLQSDPRDVGGTTITIERDPTPSDRPGPEPDPGEPAAEQASPARPDEGRPVQAIDGIGPTYGDRLAAAGVETVEELVAADPSALARETGIGVGRITTWIERARDR